MPHKPISKQMGGSARISWFATCIFMLAALTACEPRDNDAVASDQSLQENTASSQAITPSEAVIRVQVWDDTESKPLGEKAEIWFRGNGSWWLTPALEEGYGAISKDLSRRQIGVRYDGDDAIQFYPSGRDGQEITIPIKMTSDMNPEGSTRDVIVINIGDSEIEIFGLPIEAATGSATMTIQRL